MAFFNPYTPYNGYQQPAPYQQTYNPYGTQMQQSIQPVQQPQQIQPKCNLGFVTSLQDALSRIVEANSDYFYRNQNEPILYEIITDNEGRKTSHTYSYAESQPQTTQSQQVDTSKFITSEMFDNFKKGYDELVKELKELKGKVL
ncbi:MAG: hypothetical protein KBS91_01335 [Firmicutes bacterium]|nr:hypothetical protein [Candidatus Caballimonas caccae]